ncbi:hypothetical protein MPTK1_2g23710 [Marchantia polymorpha subsp. ruderalis]|uniref:Uncharacterized protein n=1 Tax=Marchantia polymorpha TaxID=3197 RepID=A0A2R6WP93_MARPO|nr:hypothetical protein MARPO_0069s0020 [Marchantia polymorpha]BBN03467.1 hypothetical protein Mp_2g23710 [Marchantia polymorpha subsp. ruderalis]|eukprot:PTQ35672.1 hypothetical protein MARPO_0069s0020 [Marchantia polymorpha]
MSLSCLHSPIKPQCRLDMCDVITITSWSQSSHFPTTKRRKVNQIGLANLARRLRINKTVPALRLNLTSISPGHD